MVISMTAFKTCSKVLVNMHGALYSERDEFGLTWKSLIITRNYCFLNFLYVR